MVRDANEATQSCRWTAGASGATERSPTKACFCTSVVNASARASLHVSCILSRPVCLVCCCSLIILIPWVVRIRHCNWSWAWRTGGRALWCGRWIGCTGCAGCWGCTGCAYCCCGLCCQFWPHPTCWAWYARGKCEPWGPRVRWACNAACMLPVSRIVSTQYRLLSAAVMMSARSRPIGCLEHRAQCTKCTVKGRVLASLDRVNRMAKTVLDLVFHASKARSWAIWKAQRQCKQNQPQTGNKNQTEKDQSKTLHN